MLEIKVGNLYRMRRMTMFFKGSQPVYRLNESRPTCLLEETNGIWPVLLLLKIHPRKDMTYHEFAYKSEIVSDWYDNAHSSFADNFEHIA